ncbi:TetR family transcriptional regulator [Acidiferrimicrobium sp. IK]|uniref:acyl-CoA-like ligand-binding transcription factor n=1 Tax=Acidiferrimicrobium sp. IK TaxID=2871700 RepID=UPI0021CAF1AD|nr:TetR family transcriptional regulator [Acidiferrimicrobium sp. IK]MCU4184981.1 TetR family transcriptional regulator [Acidiferrimicrobium sp. IK]
MGTHTETLTEQPGRRERKKQATRQALHEAAWALVEERGLAHVTIEAITDRVDVATRTFFNYYSSKEEAVLGSDSERNARVCEAVSERLAAGDSPLDAVHGAMRAESAWKDLSSDQLRRRMKLMRDEPMLFSVASAQWEEMGRRVAGIIAAAIGSDTDQDLYPLLVVNIGVVAARTAMMHWAEHPEQDLTTLIDDALAAVKAGLPVPSAGASRLAVPTAQGAST